MGREEGGRRKEGVRDEGSEGRRDEVRKEEWREGGREGIDEGNRKKEEMGRKIGAAQLAGVGEEVARTCTHLFSRVDEKGE